MAIIGGAAWCVFARQLFESDWFPDTGITFISPLAMFSVACVGSLLAQQLIERKSRKTAIVFWGALACISFMAIIMTEALQKGPGFPEGWIVALSPLAWSFLAAKVSLVGAGAYQETPWAFWFGQGAMALWWLHLLRKPKVMGDEKPATR